LKILICGRDIGPSKSLARVASAAINRGHAVRAVLFQPLSDWQNLLLWQPDIVLASPATLDWQDVLALSKATKTAGIPLAWFCDTYSVFCRPNYAELRSDIIFVPDETEAKRAQEYGYPKVIASGVPLWEEFRDMSQYLDRKKTRRELGILPEQTAVMFLGVKKGEVTLRALQEVTATLQKIEAPFVFLPRLHPGDENVKSGLYDKFFADLPLFWENTVSIAPSAESLLLATDMVISLGATTNICAAFINGPAIDYLPDYVLDNIEAQYGERVWMPAESGATLKASSIGELEQGIKSLLTPEGQNTLFSRQREIYPPDLPVGGAAGIIVREMEKLVKT